MAPEKQVGGSRHHVTSQVGGQRGKQYGMTEWGHSRQVGTFVRSRSRVCGEEQRLKNKGRSWVGRWWEPPKFLKRRMIWSEPCSR